MKNWNYWKNWLKAAGVRSLKTAMGDVNWAMVGSAAALAGILSMLTSIAGLPEVTTEEGE